MKSKLFLSFFACFLFLTNVNAQIRYTDEEIKNKYEKETMMLTLNGVEKNGVLSRFNYLFPSMQMREEMEKNGGIEANKTYKDYRKTVGIYWLISILGIVAIVLSGLFILGAATAATIDSAFLMYWLIVLVFAALATFFGKKAFRQLARSIWHYNRNVLLKK